MEFHLELLQIQPLLGLVGVQVMVEVPGGIPKAVELPLWCQQDSGRGLLVGNAGVTSLPSPVTKGKQKLWVFENPSPVSIVELSAYSLSLTDVSVRPTPYQLTSRHASVRMR